MPPKRGGEGGGGNLSTKAEEEGTSNFSCLLKIMKIRCYLFSKKVVKDKERVRIAGELESESPFEFFILGN